MSKTVEETLGHLVSDEYASCLQNASFRKPAEYHNKSKRLHLALKMERPLPYEAYHQIRHQLRIALHCAIELDIETGLTPTLDDLDQVAAYASDFTSADQALSAFIGLSPCWTPEGSLKYATESEERLEKLQSASRALEGKLKSAGWNTGVVCELNRISENSVFNAQVPDLPEMPKRPAHTPDKPMRSGGRRGGSSSRSQVVKIRDLEAGMNHIAVIGHVFDMEIRQTKTGRFLQLIYLSDYDDAIVCKRFDSRNVDEEAMRQIKVGQTLKISGEVTYDTFQKANVLSAFGIEPAAVEERKDTESEKRIEWHIHSTFSEMDGVTPIEDYIQKAWDWGWEAVAVTDHNVVQAFPLAQHKAAALIKSAPDRPFKILYGCEMSMVDTVYDTVWNNDHSAVEGRTFVVFDLETTGLSSRLDQIIEFGAVKIEDGAVIDRKQLFINPKRTLPPNIVSLTHIKQEDVDSAKPMEEVFDEIRDFIGDAVLVAHNARFDHGMLNAAARELGKEEFNNPVIDTMPMARSLLDLKSYRLGNVCRKYGVLYDGEGAHRADYDAEVLSSVFLHMLNHLGSDVTLDTIANMDSSTALRKNHPMHITVFARNKDGLKDLFELVTLSHTTYLSYSPTSSAGGTTGTPRIPRAELEKYHAKGNLLFGSSCQNGELFELAHTRSRKELEDAMDFYDYVELQPLDCYKNLLDRQAIANRDDLMTILRYLLEAAKAKNKPVIASSDAHYCEPHDKRIRDVYINAKTGGAGRHPLYKYNAYERRTLSSPNQHLLTTREMLDAFAWLEDPDLVHEIVIENPKKLSEFTEAIYPIKDRLYPPDIEGSDQKLRDICYETAVDWYGDPLPEPVKSRLDRELNAIIGAGYYVVYYISHLLVKKSNEDGYLVGSRGSVGSSFVATMSGITEVNPLKPHYLCRKCHHLEWVDDGSVHSGFDLPDKVCPDCGEIMRGDGQDIPFETFLGFEGDKVPDIDLNFSGDYQPRAHAFTKTIFGDDHVFRAGTVSGVQEKTAYGFVKGYEEEMEMEPMSEAARTDLAKSCTGVKRTSGQHPGGIVVVPLDMDVHDFTPVQYPANNPYAEWKTTHFDFHQIHDNILKFDILGHVDPTAMKMMERLSGIDVTTLPMNDPETMKIFSSTESLGLDSTLYNESTGAMGIPEFGTPFVRGILELTRPTTFAELVSISGLSHGTNVWLNNAKDLIDAGICNLRQVIGCRDDIMVDLIRYGLPKKASFTIMESVRKGKGLKPEWEELMKEHNVPEWYMDSCRKIKYMFPKAHAVAYVMMAVRIAWFKVHMPLVYYCQFFSIRSDALDIAVMMEGKTAIQSRMAQIAAARADKSVAVSNKELATYDTLELAYEMVMRGYHFSRISISRSAADEFIPDPDDDKAIIPPFTALDALGVSVAKSIVEAREQRAFLSKEDILQRTSLSRTLLDKLDYLGALEGLDERNQLSLF